MNINYLSVIIALGIFFSVFFIHIILKVRNPLLSTTKNIVSGIVALLAVNLVGSLTSVTIPISILSLGVSSIAGIPGVTLLLMLNLI